MLIISEKICNADHVIDGLGDMYQGKIIVR